MSGIKKGAGSERNPVSGVRLTHAVSIWRMGMPCFAPRRGDITLVQQLECPGEGFRITLSSFFSEMLKGQHEKVFR
jgi:hypothetical protein